MTTLTTNPYELLLRFDEAGKVTGAHVVRRQQLHDAEGTLLMERLTDPQPLALDHAAVLAAVAALG